MKPQKLLLADIRMDGGTQSRAALSEDAIADYAAAYLAKVPMPPVVVFADADGTWLADGFHRCYGAQRAKQKNIAAEVRHGGLRDAILFAVGANVSHGLRRTNADKRRAVEMLLRDEDWAERSDRWVAETAGVHHETVAALRVELAISPVEGRGGQDGKTRKVPQKAEAGGAQAIAEAPLNAVGEAHETPTSPESAPPSGGAVVPGSGGAQPGDRETDSASPANVSPDEGPSPGIDMRGLAASPDWFRHIAALTNIFATAHQGLRMAKAQIGRLTDEQLHRTHFEPLKFAIAEALRELEQRSPTSACLACKDPEGPAGRREQCGVCLGLGYIVASQEAGAVTATKKKPAKATPAIPCASPPMSPADEAALFPPGKEWTPPPKRPPPRNRIILQREDGTETPFTPGEDW